MSQYQYNVIETHQVGIEDYRTLNRQVKHNKLIGMQSRPCIWAKYKHSRQQTGLLSSQCRLQETQKAVVGMQQTKYVRMETSQAREASYRLPYVLASRLSIRYSLVYGQLLLVDIKDHRSIVVCMCSSLYLLKLLATQLVTCN